MPIIHHPSSSEEKATHGHACEDGVGLQTPSVSEAAVPSGRPGMSESNKGSPPQAPRLMMVGVGSRSPILSMAYNIKQQSNHIDAEAAKAFVSAAYSSKAHSGDKSSPPEASSQTADIDNTGHERRNKPVSKNTSPVKARLPTKQKIFSPLIGAQDNAIEQNPCRLYLPLLAKKKLNRRR